VNSYKFILKGDDQYINVPVEIKWDFNGRDDSIDEYQDDIITQLIGGAGDFEVFRFDHDVYGVNNESQLNYDFKFYTGDNTTITASTVTTSDWKSTYIGTEFNQDQVYRRLKPFTKSFYKLDFYDTTDTTVQTNYFTVILPVNGGDVIDMVINQYIGVGKVINPTFTLDFIRNNEGFFIYWLRSREYIDIDTFYMSAKFFNAGSGYWVKMMTQPQVSLSNKFQFNNDLFYNKIKLNYDDKTYQLFDMVGNRIGTGNPITWYEYVNP
jgi:hypothetical protein